MDLNNKKFKIFIVDDHPIMIEGIVKVIEKEENFIVCGTSEDIDKAQKDIENLKPDVVAVDFSINTDSDGLDLIRKLKELYPNLPTLVLSTYNDRIHIEQAIKAGAMGYVTKREVSEILIRALKKILKGEFFLSEQISSNLLADLFQEKSEINSISIDVLTKREREIFELIGEGFNTKKIASSLCISTNTVDTYRDRIKKKLNLKSSNELVFNAIRWRQGNKGFDVLRK